MYIIRWLYYRESPADYLMLAVVQRDCYAQIVCPVLSILDCISYKSLGHYVTSLQPFASGYLIDRYAGSHQISERDADDSCLLQYRRVASDIDLRQSTVCLDCQYYIDQLGFAQAHGFHRHNSNHTVHVKC